MQTEKLSADAPSPIAMRRLAAADNQVRPLAARSVDLNCSRCGYGIVSREPPERCPMCGTAPVWVERSQPPSQQAAL
jgi:predicted Zn-ribbon and HTH transcriptional regulator